MDADFYGSSVRTKSKTVSARAMANIARAKKRDAGESVNKARYEIAYAK
jgi:hypothetical protein